MAPVGGAPAAAQTFEGRYQTTRTPPLRADGTSHRWALTYDPEGEGRLTFELDGETYSAPLEPGHKADGAEFNRFGLWNHQNSGQGLEVYFDDLTLNGAPIDLDRDPAWEARGNEVDFDERVVRPFHDFGFNATRNAGGRPGEIGGLIWRDERPTYYADRVGRLNLDDELRASGKVSLTSANSDSGVYLGWFDAASKQREESPSSRPMPHNFLAVMIEGPSRDGHYVRPAYRTGPGDGDNVPRGTHDPSGRAIRRVVAALLPVRSGRGGPDRSHVRWCPPGAGSRTRPPTTRRSRSIDSGSSTCNPAASTC